MLHALCAPLLVVACFLATACSLTQPEVAPIADGLTLADRINEARLARELALIDRITGDGSADVQAAWRAAAIEDAEQIRELHDQFREWVAAIGELDWRALYRQIRKELGAAQEGGS